MKALEARLPAKTTPQDKTNAAPACMPSSSFNSRCNLPEMHPHILPDEQQTAEMQELRETMPGQQWVRTDKVHPLQRLLDADRERKARGKGRLKQQTTAKNKRGKGKERRQAQRGAGRAVVIETESVDGNLDTRRDSMYGSATEFASGLHSRPPPRGPWTEPKAASIINIVALCTYPGQTIKPSSSSHLFILQQRINAAVNNEGPLTNIATRTLVCDILSEWATYGGIRGCANQ